MIKIISNLVSNVIASSACIYVGVFSSAPDNLKLAATCVLIYLGWSLNLINK